MSVKATLLAVSRDPAGYVKQNVHFPQVSKIEIKIKNSSLRHEQCIKGKYLIN